MKRIFILIMAIAPIGAFAAAPSTTCPAGYVAVEESYMEIADSACPIGYTFVGTANSCLISSPAGSCIMYAPTNITYTDDTGSYEFTSACPLK